MSKLNLSNKIKDLHYVHIVKLIRINPITCARYYDHKTFSFHKLMTKNHYIFVHFKKKKFVIEFHNCVNEHAHGLLLIKNTSMYGMHTNEKIE
jgi:hypothetical protein